MSVKRFGLLLAVVGSGWFGWQIYRLNQQPLVPPPSPSPAATSSTSIFGLSEQEDKLIGFEINGTRYRTAWVRAAPEQPVKLGLNQVLEKSSEELQQQQACTVLTSGGFYREDGIPLGWLVSDGKELSPYAENWLINGILLKDDRGYQIRRDKPSNSELQWAVQTGPVLWEDGRPTALRLQRDQAARRLVAAVTKDKQLTIAVVTAADSLFGGPLLKDMPAIVGKLEAVTGQEFASAINLDGGTASAFLSETVKLKELKPIGSFFCIK